MKNKYKLLIECLENTYGAKVLYSKDCLSLSEEIFQSIQIKISAQTLRRLYGYIKDGVEVSRSTVNYLSLYCGYDNYNDLLKHYKKVEKNEESKDVKFVKLFFSIVPKNVEKDENYHNASKNISQLVLKNNGLLEKLSTYLSKSPSAQIFFF